MPKYGISTGCPLLTESVTDRRRQLDEIKAVGAQYVRVDLGTGDTDQFDAVLADAKVRGLQVMAILFGTTGYVSPSDAYTFAEAQASRLASNVTMFEFCNEPQSNGWNGTAYGGSLIGAHNGLKAGNPNAIMIAGALGSPVSGVPQFVLDMYAAGAKGHFDVLSLHLYDDPDTRGDWNMWDWAFYTSPCVRSIMDSNGDSAIPIISTETGLPSVDPGTGLPDADYNETKQATVCGHDFDHIGTGLTSDLGSTASMCWYNMVDDNPPAGVCDGLLHSDYSKKPAWYIYQSRAQSQ